MGQYSVLFSKERQEITASISAAPTYCPVVVMVVDVIVLVSGRQNLSSKRAKELWHEYHPFTWRLLLFPLQLKHFIPTAQASISVLRYSTPLSRIRVSITSVVVVSVMEVVERVVELVCVAVLDVDVDEMVVVDVSVTVVEVGGSFTASELPLKKRMHFIVRPNALRAFGLLGFGLLAVGIGSAVEMHFVDSDTYYSRTNDGPGLVLNLRRNHDP